MALRHQHVASFVSHSTSVGIQKKIINSRKRCHKYRTHVTTSGQFSDRTISRTPTKPCHPIAQLSGPVVEAPARLLIAWRSWMVLALHLCLSFTWVFSWVVCSAQHFNLILAIPAMLLVGGPSLPCLFNVAWKLYHIYRPLHKGEIDSEGVTKRVSFALHDDLIGTKRDREHADVHIKAPCYNAGGDPDRGCGDPNPPKKSRLLSDEQHLRTLACPFWKFNPVRHASCFEMKLAKISRVKQHLTRKHCPEHYCERCMDIFPSEETLDLHTRQLNPCPASSDSNLDGLSHLQRRNLMSKSKRNSPVSEQWFAIWDIIFPGHPRPSSPYMDTETSMNLTSFREFTQSHGSSMLTRRLIDSGLLPTSDTNSAINEVMHRGLEELFQVWMSAGTSSATSSSSSPPTALPLEQMGDIDGYENSEVFLGVEPRPDIETTSDLSFSAHDSTVSSDIDLTNGETLMTPQSCLEAWSMSGIQMGEELLGTVESDLQRDTNNPIRLLPNQIPMPSDPETTFEIADTLSGTGLSFDTVSTSTQLITGASTDSLSSLWSGATLWSHGNETPTTMGDGGVEGAFIGDLDTALKTATEPCKTPEN